DIAVILLVTNYVLGTPTDSTNPSFDVRPKVGSTSVQVQASRLARSSAHPRISLQHGFALMPPNAGGAGETCAGHRSRGCETRHQPPAGPLRPIHRSRCHLASRAARI